jgi:hypothetical protein
MGKIYDKLKKGLQEIIAHQEGRITLKSEFIEIPRPPKAYGPKKNKNIRAK